MHRREEHQVRGEEGRKVIVSGAGVERETGCLRSRVNQLHTHK